MNEIGGYIEFEKYSLPMLHEEAIALNCGRNCLAYLIRAKKIKKILLPRFLCASVKNICIKENIEIKYYSIDWNFMPCNISLQEDEWLYIVNYYGQLSNEVLEELNKKYGKIIVDNSHAYYQIPLQGVDTIYTCRKYFGVADGAFLYTDARVNEQLARDESYERMRFLMGRFERTASEFYKDYSNNNHLFVNEPIKMMSKLTENLLHGINYTEIEEKRTQNFRILHHNFQEINKLNLKIPNGAFMYPLYLKNSAIIREKMQQKKIYIPTLWPDVYECCSENDIEYDMTKNILPLPVDQRYDEHVMRYIVEEILKCIKN